MRDKKCNGILILLIVELFILLALLVTCFRKEELVDTFWGEDIIELTVPMGGHAEFYSDKMVLTPGVYQVRVKSVLSDEQKMYVQMKCEHSYFKSLRNNGMTIFSNQDYADFEVYVLDKVSAAYVQCDFFGVDADGLVQLEIWKTNIGNRMLLFSVLVFCVILDFLIVFRKRVLEGKIAKKQQVVFWTLIVGVFLAYFPHLTDYFFSGADSVFHWGRIAYLADALRQGSMLPIRIEGTWLDGHGYASPLFYADFFLFIPACLRLIGFSIMSAYKMYLFLMLAATAVISYLSFKRCVKDEYAALFGCMIYILTPYHLLNIYNRGAVGEYSAMAFLPIVCCGMYLLYTEDVTSKEYKKYKWYVVWGMTAILQSHLITTEMTAVLMAVCCVILWKKTFRRQTFCQLLEATGIVLLINAWFWLPMIYMMRIDTYQLETVISKKTQNQGVFLAGLFQLLPNQGGAQTGMWNCEPRQIGVAAMLLLLIYGLWCWRRGKKTDYTCRVLVLFVVLLIVMSTRYVPWDAIMQVPYIGYIVASIQFPVRWLSPASMFVSIFAAFSFRQVKEQGGMLMKAAISIAAVLVIASAVYHVNDIALEFGPVWLYNEENMGTVSVVQGEYLLSGTKDTDFYYHKPVAEDGLAWSEYEKNGTNVTIALDNRTEETRHIEIPLTGYKGYGISALEIEGEVPFITEERGAHGDLRIAVPAGYQGTVKISYVGFALFHVAEAVSLLSLMIILGVHLYPYISLLRSRFRKREEIAV